MATNGELLALRVPTELKKGLEALYPDTATRNNVIRAALAQIIKKQIVIPAYEIDLPTSISG